MSNKTIINNVLGFVFVFLYKIVLDYIYINFVHELYAYSGFLLNINFNKYIYSIIYLIMIYAFLPKDSKKPSSVILQLHFIIMIIPMLSLYSLSSESGMFMGLVSTLFILQCVILRMVPNIQISRINSSSKIIKWIVITISIVVYTNMIVANGLPSLGAFDFTNVYNIRKTTNYSHLMVYLVNWQAKVINPFLLTTSYIERDKKKVAVSIFLQLFLYLITAHKTFLFIPIAILIIMKVTESNLLLAVMTFLSFIGSGISYLVYNIFGNITIPSLFIRRFLFVPAKLKFNYYDFFSQNKFLYFSEGVIGKVFGIKSVYEIKIPNLIGYLYGNSIETWANTGYLADAYSNMGILGMLIMTLLFVLILIMINSLGNKISKELVIGLSLFSMLSLNDGALLTSLLTGGLLLLLLLLYLYSNNSNNLKDNKFFKHPN